MSPQKVLVLGAGAAGTSAARVLAGSDAVTVTLIGRTDETPYNRTLVNKGVAIGLLTPEQAVIPGVEALGDTVLEVDTDTKTVRFASGRVEDYDALILATGSVPRLPGDSVRGASSDRITTLHSLDDAIAVRNLLTGLGRPAQVVISGAGLVAAETATLLRERGHQITLLARTQTPGATVFGDELAQRLATAHQQHLDTAFGRTLTAVRETGDRLELTFDDGTELPADLLIVAHGTTPTAPSPWDGPVAVDDSLRAAAAHVYAAGGVAVHDDPTLGVWRIDHWSDAAAQGEHAARTLLADLGAGEQPGSYQPRAPFTATVHGAMIAGAGLTSDHTSSRTESTDPLVIIQQRDGLPVGVLGLDAAPAVFGWMPKLYTPAAPDAEALASTGTGTADSNNHTAQGT
ncbi:NAD(P)/FAD-dependent oxidoreductase [uncultured Microbacterium sp.]|uniref:NAD(P)/FAD-dependent oxidoreductase n=1 Tax=uncultured Microbacterium sp. TaxID=191216 RepID=UPI00263022CD|nr:NAD(P)/FAD-dependent oxidoreductase [uncultured Microbacterium sp.]